MSKTVVPVSMKSPVVGAAASVVLISTARGRNRGDRKANAA